MFYDIRIEPNKYMEWSCFQPHYCKFPLGCPAKDVKDDLND